jgi:glycerophosphoryl diester phosphodiesterase
MNHTNFVIANERSLSLDVQGHRGARARRPENTLPAFEYATSIGVDTLELDTLVTKDNVVVVHHDADINVKLCQYKNGKKIPKDLLIRNLTLKQIKEFDCGSKVNKKFPNQKLFPGAEIPTLSEVFELIKKSKSPKAASIRFNIEMKSEAKHPEHQPDPKTFAELLIKECDKAQLLDRVTLQSFDHRTLISARQILPEIQLAALFADKPKDIVKATRAAQAQIVSPHFELITKKDVADIHNAGLLVVPWTVNTEVDWLHVIELGVDGIITDDPEALLKFLNRF